MTEAEWLTCEDPHSVLRGLPSGAATERKMRLFGCASCYRFWDEIEDPRCREAIETSERYADGLVSERELDRLSAAAEEAFEAAASDRDDWLMHVTGATSDVSNPSVTLAGIVGTAEALSQASWGGPPKERTAQVGLLRDIFGNPFRLVPFDLSWQTDTATALAREMYESRDFSAMPILADALQDAGCNNDDILNHCRDVNAAHVRGCWVVDLVLGKG